MEYKKFLYNLFETKPDNSFINIWTLPLKHSHFFKNIDDAVQFITSIKDKKIDAYIGCGFTKKNFGKRRRGKKEDIAGLPAFFMDIDFRTKTKPNAPPDLKAAMSLIEGFGYDPTMVISSGNGIHAWWVFKECWEFEKDDWILAESLNGRLQATIKARAAEHGWELDSTQDNTRVLRIPGTKNYKDTKNPKIVEFYKNSEHKYSDPIWFDDVLLKSENITTPVSATEVTKISENLKIDITVEPPTDLFDELVSIDPKFMTTWQRNREDLKDNSLSAYALSLSNFAAHANWSDKDMSSLIIAFYRRHGSNLKKLHPTKIALTIAKARATVDESEITDFIENIVPAQGTIYEKVVDPDGEKARNAVCKILKMTITKIIQFEQEKDSHYRIYLKGNTQIPIKNIEMLRKQELFVSRIAEKTRHEIDIDAKKWKYCKKNFNKFMIVVAPGARTTHDRMILWLEDYLQDKRTIDVYESLDGNEPFVHNGFWYVYDKKFRNFAYLHYGETQPIDKTQLDLGIIGAEKVRMDKKLPENQAKRKTIRPWKIPHDIAIPPTANITIADGLVVNLSEISKGEKSEN